MEAPYRTSSSYFLIYRLQDNPQPSMLGYGPEKEMLEHLAHEVYSMYIVACLIQNPVKYELSNLVPISETSIYMKI